MIPKQKKTFTLIEMLIVIVIIGILAAALIPKLQNTQERARDASRIKSVKDVANAIDIYYQDMQKYPMTGLFIMSPYVDTNNQIDTCGYASRRCTLGTTLQSYITSFPKDNLLSQYYGGRRFIYKSINGDIYGLGVVLDTYKTNTLSKDDGGQYDQIYELGGLPSYCKNKYGVSKNRTSRAGFNCGDVN